MPAMAIVRLGAFSVLMGKATWVARRSSRPERPTMLLQLLLKQLLGLHKLLHVVAMAAALELHNLEGAVLDDGCQALHLSAQCIARAVLEIALFGFGAQGAHLGLDTRRSS